MPQTRRRQVLLTDAMLIAMALIWAVNYSVLKFGTRMIPPLAYNGVRIPAAALLQFQAAATPDKDDHGGGFAEGAAHD